MTRRSTLFALVASLVLSMVAIPVTAADHPSAAGTVACPDGAPDAGFDDVSASSTHARAIDCATHLDIVRGVTARAFAPGRSVTRAQLASLLARTLDELELPLPPVAGSPTFSDIDEPHGDNIRRLAAAGIVEGKSDGRFDPAAPVTRAQLASLLVRTLAFARNLDVVATAGPHFADVSSAAHGPNIDAALEQGLLLGRTADRFEPSAPTRRDQAATVVVRLLEDVLGTEAVRAAGGEVWVLDQGTDLIHVYDGDDRFAELTTIDVRPATLRAAGFPQAPTGTNTVPHMIEFDSQERYAFIAATAGGVTIIVDARSKEVVEVLRTGPGSHMAAVTPDDSAAWVAVIGTAGRAHTRGVDDQGQDLDAFDRKMVEIPLDLDAAEPRFAIGRQLHLEGLLAPLEAANGWEYPSLSPVCHQYSPDSSEAWITLGPGWNQGGLVVLDLASGTLVEEAAFDPAVVKANCGVSVTEDRVLVNWSGKVVAGEDTNGEWYVIDPVTYELQQTRDSEGSDAHGLRLTRDGASYWQVNRNSDNALVIDAATLEVTRRYANIAVAPDILDYSPGGELVYITQRGPTPRSGAIHAASGDQPGLAVIEEATGRKLGVISQPPVQNDQGAVVNDIHGVGVRTLTDGDPQPAAAQAASVSFQAPRPSGTADHCALPTAT
jgi:DNA-binding beta-propeller fold protein YncE